ncbi:MAG: DUF1839 family protein [Hyphomicrobiales bacterium]|nr:DUF1839 family protein [Hyphomicrobiales bacterium]
MAQPVPAVLSALDPSTYVPHALHDLARPWPETNCYVDVWIEILAAMGLEPAAAAGFTVAQDYEGDQFTFFKFPPEDLELLFGLTVQELAIYTAVDAHAAEQIARGRLPLIEVDSYFLPDTAGLSYRLAHTKTTIGLNRIDVAGRRAEYFHNRSYFVLEGDDFDGVFRRGAHAASADALFPYVEFIKRARVPVAGDLVRRARRRLAYHLSRRPAANPFNAFRHDLAAHIERLRGGAHFHDFAFNTVRQFGANYGLLSAHLDWLSLAGVSDMVEASAAARRIAEGAKVLQFQLARAAAGREPKGVSEGLDRIVDDYDRLMDLLERAVSARRFEAARGDA